MTRYISKSLTALRHVFCYVILSFMGVLALAQDKGIDVDINVKKENEWYQQPWVWVVGGAVFILLLVALLRSGSAKDRGA